MMKSHRNYFMQKGFSLIEVVFFVFITGSIVAIVGMGFSKVLDQQMLNSDVEILVSAIGRARGFTLASRDPGSIGSGITNQNDGRRYGVYFDTTSHLYSIFYATNIQEYDITREVERVSLSLSYISSVTIPCGAVPTTPCSAGSPANRTIVFKRLTGDVLARKNPPISPSDITAFPFAAPYTTIVLQSRRSSTLTKTIRVYPTGIIQVL